MNRWMVSARPRNSCARARPSSRIPVPASKIRMSCPDRSSTQAVLPPYSVVAGPGAAIEPRVSPEGHAESGSGPVGSQALHARHQLVGIEGLDHVVVGAHLLRAVDVRLVRLRGDHDDDGRASSASARRRAEHLEAVHVVHDDVADDDRGAMGPREGDSVAALRAVSTVEAAVLEDEGEELEEPLVVVDHEEGSAGRRPGTRRRRHGAGAAQRRGPAGRAPVGDGAAECRAVIT